MKRCFLIAVLLLSSSAFAQFTLVTGTVTDPNGVPYALGTIAPLLITSATPTFTATGQLYFPPSQASGLDGTGHFLVRIADNTALTPGGTTWNFTVCSAIGTVQPSFGTGPQCFKLAAPITISGASQDISTNLNAVAPALTLPFGAGGSVSGSGTAHLPAIWSTSSSLTDTTLTDNFTAPNTGSVANSRIADWQTTFDTSGTQTITNLYTFGFQPRSINAGASTAWTNGYVLWGKSPLFAGKRPNLFAFLQGDDQTTNLSGNNIVQTNFIKCAPQITSIQSLGSWCLNAAGPNSTAQYQNHAQPKVLSSGVSTPFINLAAQFQSDQGTHPNNWVLGGQINFCVYAQLGQTTTTPSFQSTCGTLVYSAVDANGVIGGNVGSVINTSTSASTGTLTATFSGAASSGTWQISCTATSSLASPTLTLFYDVENYGLDTWGPTGFPQ